MRVSLLLQNTQKLRSELEALIEHGRTTGHKRQDDIFVNAYVVRSHWRRRSYRSLKVVRRIV